MKIDIERLKQLCAKGLTRVQIAQRLGVTHNAVLLACKRHGISAVVAEGYESRAGSSARSACEVTENCGSEHELPRVTR